MANFAVADIKALRERTGAGMMDVKKALDEAAGDVEKALELIRIKGLKGATKREGRSAIEGLVTAGVADGAGVMLEINCETDFVAKSEPFVTFAQRVLDVALSSKAENVEDLLNVKVDQATLSDLAIEVGAILGEKVVIRRLARLEGPIVDVYLHKTSKDLPAQVGVLCAGQGDMDTVTHDVAVHIAAMAPTYLHRDEVPEELVVNERRIAEETARAEGKPEAALSKIVEGRLQGFFKEHVLLEQPFAKETKKSVAQIVEAAGVKILGFARFRVGG